MEIFKLFGSIALKGGEKVKKGIKEIGERAKKSTGSLKKFGSGLKSVGAIGLKFAGAIAAAGAATVAFAFSQFTAIDAMAKAAAGAGTTAEEYQRLTFALGQFAGVTAEQVTPALRRVNTLVGQAATGNKGAADALKGLGFGLSEIASGSIKSGEALDAVFQKINDSKSDAEASAIASKFFGEEMSKLGPILKGNKGAFDELKKSFEGGITNEDAKKVEAFNDKWDIMSRKINDVFTKVSIDLIPVFEELIEWMDGDGKPVIDGIAGAFSVVAKVVLFLVQALGKLFKIFTSVSSLIGGGLGSIGINENQNFGGANFDQAEVDRIRSGRSGRSGSGRSGSGGSGGVVINAQGATFNDTSGMPGQLQANGVGMHN